MCRGKALGKAIGFVINDKVDVALAIKRGIFGAVLGNRRETHILKQSFQGPCIGSGILDKLKSIRSHWIIYFGHDDTSFGDIE